jgi:hypothetical protein
MDTKIEDYRTMRLREVARYIGNKSHFKRTESFANLQRRAQTLSPILRHFVDGAVETAQSIVRNNPGYVEADHPQDSTPRVSLFPWNLGTQARCWMPVLSST